MKSFDRWNKLKINTENQEQSRWSQPRDIWWCRLGVNVGFEQDGKGQDFLRPVIVLNSFGIYTALVVPLTTSTKENKYHFDCGEIAGEKSFAIITQLRLLDTKRFVEKSGKVDMEIFDQLKEAIKTLF